VGFVLLFGAVLWVAGPLGCGDCDLDVKTSLLPDATLGAPYNVELDSDCGGDVWLIATGLLPPGISFLQEGVLRGTPSMIGTYFFTVEVIDFDHGFVDETAFRGLSLTVRDTPVLRTPTPVPTATAVN
jgi:hypothetical protein